MVPGEGFLCLRVPLLQNIEEGETRSTTTTVAIT
jgi:hypothetical protein